MTTLELTTGAIAWGGGCVAKADDGRVVFVRHSLPGETVRAVITSETKSFLRADATEILEPSPDRVEPPCPFAGPGRCGGCDWQHISIAAQRQLKEQLVIDQLTRVAGIDRSVTVEEVPGAPDGLGWRTRVRFATDETGRVGLRKHRSHQLELIDQCLIATAAVNDAGVPLQRWPADVELEVFASSLDDQRVVSVTSSEKRTNRMPDLQAGVVVNGKMIRPPQRLQFDVLGHRMEVSAGSFWQVHASAAALLGQVVLDELAPEAGELAVDLYSGVGLFSVLLAAAVGSTGSVLAVERDRRACADAVRNVAAFSHVEIRHQDVNAEMIESWGGPANLVVLDPAREGAGKTVMAALAALDPAPRRMAYVSCDAGSFARDIRVMFDAGWTMPVFRAFDLFPMTEHVEMVGILEPPPH